MPEITAVGCAIKKEAGAKSYFVIKGAGFTGQSKIQVTNLNPSEWSTKIVCRDSKCLYVEVTSLEGSKQPNAFGITDITVTVTEGEETDGPSITDGVGVIGDAKV